MSKTRSAASSDMLVTGDEVNYREDDQLLITLPKKMSFGEAMKILKAKYEEQETVADFSRDYLYRPMDGAVATSIVLRSRYGLVMGKSIQTLFGEEPPQVLNVATGPGGQSVQAPWGRIQIPAISGGDVYLDATRHRDYGTIFQIMCRAKKKYAKEVEAFFNDVDEQLRNGSIYRGKAVVGADELAFIEGLDTFKPEEIVFSSDVQRTLEVALFAPLRYPTACREERIPLKRAVLLYGPYGTGKTSVGLMTAQEAVRAGWTFVMARPGRDNPEDVMTTARLYSPSVVWIEDLDTNTKDANPKAISKMLDAFDGIVSKGGGEIMVVMTTNFIEQIPQPLLRPGRLDFTVPVAELDRIGTEKLIRVVVKPGKLADDIDFDAVYSAMDGFLPAFVKATADRARLFAIDRMGGRTDYVLTTEDMVEAARSLHTQLELHNNASRGPASPPVLDQALRAAVTAGVDGMQLVGPGVSDVKLAAPGTNNSRRA